MADFDKELSRLENEVRRENDSKLADMPAKKYSVNYKGSSDHELLEFFMGFILLGAGIYWVLNSFDVTSSWGYGYYSLFGMKITGGVMLIPLLVGIGLLFFLDKKIIGACVSCLGLAIILISLLTSVSFHARYNTLFVYVLMFGMIAAGAGLLIKTLFKKR